MVRGEDSKCAGKVRLMLLYGRAYHLGFCRGRKSVEPYQHDAVCGTALTKHQFAEVFVGCDDHVRAPEPRLPRPLTPWPFRPLPRLGDLPAADGQQWRHRHFHLQPDSRGERSWIEDVGAEGFSGKGKGGLDRLASEARVGGQNLLNGFTGGKLFNDQLDGDSRSCHNRFPHHNGWIRHDELFCGHNSVTVRVG